MRLLGINHKMFNVVSKIPVGNLWLSLNFFSQFVLFVTFSIWYNSKQDKTAFCLIVCNCLVCSRILEFLNLGHTVSSCYLKKGDKNLLNCRPCSVKFQLCLYCSFFCCPLNDTLFCLTYLLKTTTSTEKVHNCLQRISFTVKVQSSKQKMEFSSVVRPVNRKTNANTFYKVYIYKTVGLLPYVVMLLVFILWIPKVHYTITIKYLMALNSWHTHFQRILWIILWNKFNYVLYTHIHIGTHTKFA